MKRLIKTETCECQRSAVTALCLCPRPSSSFLVPPRPASSLLVPPRPSSSLPRPASPDTDSTERVCRLPACETCFLEFLWEPACSKVFPICLSLCLTLLPHSQVHRQLPDFQMAPVFYESPPSPPAWFLSFSTLPLPLIPVEALMCLQRVAKNGLVCTQPGSFQELGTLVP